MNNIQPGIPVLVLATHAGARRYADRNLPLMLKDGVKADTYDMDVRPRRILYDVRPAVLHEDYCPATYVERFQC